MPGSDLLGSMERRLNGSIALFDLREKIRSFADPAHPGSYLDIGEVKSTGWETEITGSPAPGYELQVGYARLDAQYVTAAPALQGTRFGVLDAKHSC